MTGNEDYDWGELERNCSYKGGYTVHDPTVKLFWDVFHSLSLEEKKQFLLFLTGSDRIPILGMNTLKMCIQPTSDERFLPVGMLDTRLMLQDEFVIYFLKVMVHFYYFLQHIPVLTCWIFRDIRRGKG